MYNENKTNGLPKEVYEYLLNTGNRISQYNKI